MTVINIQIYEAISEAQRPKVSFHGEIVEKVETSNHLDYVIITPTMMHERDFFTNLDIEPIALDMKDAISDEEFSELVLECSTLYAAEAIIAGETCPVAVLSNGSRLLALATTHDGLIPFATKL